MIAIVDYGMGNTGSVKNALRLLGAEGVVTRDPKDFARATHIILPGVGAFGDGMKNLEQYDLPALLAGEALEKKKPFLGICLGMQLLADQGEESGGTRGLGWIPGVVRRLRVDERRFRIPHIGWDDVTASPDATLFKGVLPSVFYFVHSYVFDAAPEMVAATCDYGEAFCTAVEWGNLFGVQFHPEKSQKSGLALLRNFIARSC